MVPQRYSYPWEQLGIDFLGPLRETANGYRHILVITDGFTKWVELAATKTQGFPEVARILIEQVICRFGCPKKLLSDRGGNFLSGLAQEVYKVLKIRKVTTSSYHPQTNGLTERFNSTMCTMLSHYVSDRHDDWDSFLPYIQMAYNTAVHSSTKHAPAYMLLGRDIAMPCDVALGTHVEPQSIFTYTRDMRGRMQEAYDLVRANLERVGQRAANRYDLTRRECTLKVGDKVWMSVPHVPEGQTKKFYHKWRGPFRIYGRRGVNCRLHTLEGVAHPTLVHVEYLKPHYQYEDPNADAQEYIPWDERTPADEDRNEEGYWEDNEPDTEQPEEGPDSEPEQAPVEVRVDDPPSEEEAEVRLEGPSQDTEVDPEWNQGVARYWDDTTML